MASTRNPSRRDFFKIFGAGAVALSCGSGTKKEGDSTEELGGQTYDYIVVGSGAGGGPLACTLALAGYQVLLIEAGSDQGNNVNYQVPILHPRASCDPAMRWDYVVQHYVDPSRQNQDDKAITDPSGNPGVLYPRAAALGGCTAHHAMITVYPHESDWDNIARLLGDVDSSGNVLPTSDWAGANMRQYFTAIENCTYESQGTAGHGFGGWLQTERVSPTLGLTDGKVHQQILGAAQAIAATTNGGGILGGILGAGTTVAQLADILSADLNSASASRDTTEGLFLVPLATKNGARNGPRELIVQTAAQTSNLTVMTNTLASKILFDDQRGSGGPLRASGVEVLPAANLYGADPKAAGATASTRADLSGPPTGPDPRTITPQQILARREVILSAGSYNTPQLLLLSGIGPGGALVNLPGVGQNLQDRYEVGVVSEVSSDFETVKDCSYSFDSNDKCFQEWQESGSGPYTTDGAVVGIVLSSSRLLNGTAPTSTSPPDLFVFGLPGQFKGYFPRYDNLIFADKRHFTWAVLKAHTGNTAGTVTLRSQNAWDTPVISFNYFDTGSAGAAADDLAAVVAGANFARQINSEANTLEILPTFAKFTEDLPGSDVTDLSTWVENAAWGHHACGTCRIGPDGDPMAVLDRNFNVRGTSGLRVVDASVFPSIPGFFIVVPVYMISGKAAAAILATAASQPTPVFAGSPAPACVGDGQSSQLEGSDCCSQNGIDGQGNCLPAGGDAGPPCVAPGQPSQQAGADCCNQDGVAGDGTCN